MKLNKNIYSSLLLCLLFSFFICSAGAYGQAQEFYELRIYHLKNQEQEQRLDKYLEQAFIPAAHRAGIKKVGIFKPIAEVEAGSGTKVYVYIPHKAADGFIKLPQALQKDNKHAAAGKDFLEAPYNNPAYTRIETILLKAFSGMPQFNVPALKGAKEERVYELRSYEGHTEKISQNKIQMFNKGNEIGIFNKLGFNAVFYGEVLAGSKMPNLMYMTTFENKASRDEHWKAFSADEDWKKLRSLPEYQHNVSHQDIIFLRPAVCSEI